MDIRRNSKVNDDKIPQIPRLHIPRASLSSSTSSNASTSKSSSLCRNPNANQKFLSGGESETEGIYRSSISQQQKLPIGNNKNLSARQDRYLVHKAPKPSSLHSLSSTSSSLSTNGSNQSNYVSQAHIVRVTMSTADSYSNDFKVIEGSRPLKMKKKSIKLIKIQFQ
jgi:hypothetical protein